MQHGQPGRLAQIPHSFEALNPILTQYSNSFLHQRLSTFSKLSLTIRKLDNGVWRYYRSLALPPQPFQPAQNRHAIYGTKWEQ